jgi:class 3 adenylate cyclase
MADSAGGFVLVGCNGMLKGQAFPITKLPYTIGRTPTNDLALAGDGCSSGRHCRIDGAEGRLWLEDLGSKNGTFLNGAKIAGRQELLPGQSVICVGQTRFSLLPASGTGQDPMASGTQSIMLRGSVIVPSRLAAGRRAEEALLVLDLCASTALAHRHGEAAVSRCVAMLTEAVEASSFGRGILFLKCTGDGFFASFAEAAQALGAGRYLLDWLRRHAADTGVPNLAIRIGIHHGEVQTDDAGDRAGLAAHLVFRLQGAGPEDRVQAPPGMPEIPPTNRILLTLAAVERLPEAARAGIRPLGDFRFKGFEATVPVHLCRAEGGQ